MYDMLVECSRISFRVWLRTIEEHMFSLVIGELMEPPFYLDS